MFHKEDNNCTNCFKSLGVPSRMAIYKYLTEKGKVSVSELVEHVNLTQPTVSYHLKEMKESGILASEKAGKEVYYKVNYVCPHYDVECVLSNIKFPESVKHA